MQDNHKNKNKRWAEVLFCHFDIRLFWLSIQLDNEKISNVLLVMHWILAEEWFCASNKL